MTEAGVDATINKLTDSSAIMAYPVASMQGLVIDKVVKTSGDPSRRARSSSGSRRPRGNPMLTIKVFGTTPPCAKCKRAEREALFAAARFPGQAEVIKLDALGPEAERYGLIVTPTIVVGDEIVASGRVLMADQLAALIASKLGG